MKQAEAALATVRTELAQYDDAIAIARNPDRRAGRRRPERGDALDRTRAPHARPATALPPAMPLDLVGAPAGDRRVALARRGGAATTSRSRRRMFYPNVNLVAFVGLTSLGLSNLLAAGSAIAGVGPAIHLPIFEGGRLNANLRGREADARSRGQPRTTRR